MVELSAKLWATVKDVHAGQNNINQRIQHHQKVKDENNALKLELAAVREQAADSATRCGTIQYDWVNLRCKLYVIVLQAAMQRMNAGTWAGLSAFWK